MAFAPVPATRSPSSSTGTVRTTHLTPGGGDAINSASAGVTVTVAEDGVVETLGDSSAGVKLRANATVNIHGAVRTGQDDPSILNNAGDDGVSVGGGSAVTLFDTGTITTGTALSTGGTGDGIVVAHASGNTDLTTVTADGTITTFGASSVGIWADATTSDDLDGATRIDLGGTITTSGNFSHGTNALGASIEVSGSIVTSGAQANGAFLGEQTSLTVDEDASIETSGPSSHGIFVENRTSGMPDAADLVINGTVEATGAAANGIYAWTNPPYPPNLADELNLSINVGETGEVHASQAAAIYADEGNLYGYPSVNVDLVISGTVAAPSASAMAIVFHDGDDRIELHPTYSITGNIDAGTGTDSFDFTGAANTSASFDFDANALTNFENYEKDGAGTWELDGDGSALGGSFAVGAGKLVVDASMGGTTFDVDAGATLGGIGTLGSTTIEGTHAPGSSIGTETVAGDYANHGTLEIEIDPSTADRVVVTGDVDISGATLKLVELTSAGWSDQQSYTIIDNQGTNAVTGTFGAIDNLFAFLEPDVDYFGDDGNNVVLGLTRNALAFQDVAETENQRGAAAGVESLGGGNPIFDAVLVLGEDDARAAFDNLSGEIHATALGAVFDSPWFREGILARLRAAAGNSSSAASNTASTGAAAQALAYAPSSDTSPALARFPTDRWRWWAVSPEAYGAVGSRDGDGNAASADITSGGLMVGADRASGNALFGIVAGLQVDLIDVSRRQSEADVATAQLAAYASWESMGWRARGGLIGAVHAFDTTRDIVVPGLVSTATADYTGLSGQAFGEIGHDFALGTRVAAEPYLGFRYAASWRDAFSETGTGPANLSGEEETLSSPYSLLGVNVRTDLPMPGGRALAGIAWEHAFSDVTPAADLAFPASAGSFHILGPTRAEDTLRLALDAELDLSPTATASLGFDGGFARHATDAEIRAAAAIHF